MDEVNAFHPEVKWNINLLPIIPEKFKLKIKKGCKDQVKLIGTLLKECDEVINAGDPDREGQLLIDETLEHLKNKKPVKRVWLNALDDESISKAFMEMKDNKKYIGYKEAAETRSQIDWLVGMNLSRAFTSTYKKNGQSYVSIGRVQTPTLKLIVDNHFEILNFTSCKYYTLQIDVGFFMMNDRLSMNYVVSERYSTYVDEEGRLKDKNILNEVIESIKGKNGEVVKCKSQTKTTPQPLGFSLSELQSVANKKYGYGAKQTLQIVQELYESKLVSYPRTDCQYLPESQYQDSSKIIKAIQSMGLFNGYKEDDNIKSRIWNDKKVTAHHAIIPTQATTDFNKLDDKKRNMYTIIAERYLVQFLKLHEYKEMEIEVKFGDELFKKTVKTDLELGWKRFFKDDNEEEKDGTYKQEFLNLFTATKSCLHDNPLVNEKNSKPPKRYTEGSLIKTMENISSKVADIVLKEEPDKKIAKEKIDKYKKILGETSGIGTEATRADIIEKLKNLKYIELKSKDIYPSEFGISLIQMIEENKTFKKEFGYITNPITTAEMELKLKNIQDTTVKKEEILNAFIEKMKRLSHYEELERTLPGMDNEHKHIESIICDKCGNKMVKKKSKTATFWGCTGFPACKNTKSLQN